MPNQFINIKFQEGVVDPKTGPNGCQIEDVLDLLLDRLSGFQNTPMACRENAKAMAYLTLAASQLIDRTRKRQEQGVEGTNQAHKS